MRHFVRAAAIAAVAVLSVSASAVAQDAATSPTQQDPAQQEVAPVHALAMHGEPKYGPDFGHFDYVNPNAPKGGVLKMYAIGSFDTLHPFIIKGTPPAGAALSYDTLLTSSADEAFTEYGLIAESIEMPEDRSWVIFNLRPEARFHDDQPVTAEDVVFSFEKLKEEGDPLYRFYYANVEEAVALDEHRVKFVFDGQPNRELPLIVGQMPILPKHYWEDREFGATTLEAPVGSGPYRIASFEPGRYISYVRVKDWWANDLPVTRGLYNFDEIRYDYFRDTTVALEAFKAGAYDVRAENVAKQWAAGYDFPAREAGQVVLTEFPHDMPSGMQGFAFNMRRPVFADPRVRWAIAHAFDFDWANTNLFYDQYTRTKSYFDNSDLASTGLPSEEELAILEPLKGSIPEEVFTQTYEPPSSTGKGAMRENLRKAFELLNEAGWEVRNGVMTNIETGNPLEFEILLSSPTFERVALPFVQNLKRLGIKTGVRTVDSAQYENRVESFDFDMTVASWGQSLSPGNEQREYWGSSAADAPGSRNYSGIKSKAVDQLVDAVINAPDREALVARSKALDRVLLWNHLVVPHWHIPYTRIAYWDKFGMPETVPMRGVQLFSWWADPSRTAEAEAAQREEAIRAGATAKN